MVIVPSSAVETMGLGGLLGTAALAAKTLTDVPPSGGTASSSPFAHVAGG